MREILLRGQRKDNREWVFGCLLQDKDLNKCWIEFFDYYSSETGLERDCIQCEVLPETIGQYTGLIDKNGKKIFEGDIIENHDFNAEDGEYGVVEYSDGAFEINGNGISSTFHENYWGQECKVVGNIYDDPELLGGTDNG